MYARNLSKVPRLKRLIIQNSFTTSAKTFKLSQKSHSAITTQPYLSFCLPNQFSFLSCKSSHEISLNQEESQWKKNAPIGGLFWAFMIFILGAKEALCDSEQKNDVDVKGSTSTHKPKTSKVKKSKKSKEKSPEGHAENKQEEQKDDNNDFSNQENKFQKETLPSLPSPKSKEPLLNNTSLTFKAALERSRALLDSKIYESGVPGLSISVSVNGKLVWAEGVGLADIENHIRMSSISVMRIASISKPLTLVAICQLIEEGKLDLDAPVQKYVPSFPKKFVDGEEVTITTRHLLSHTSGIRHYELKSEYDKRKEKQKKKEKRKEQDDDCEMEEEDDKCDDEFSVMKKKKKTAQLLASLSMRSKKEEDNDSEFKLEEYHIKETFKDTKEALKLFQDDELFFKPGEGYHYTTHGYTLVAAVIEGASGKKFTDVMKNLFRDLAMTKTKLDQHEPIIRHRARMYTRDKKGRLKNAPYVDTSYKWAGGGFLSNVIDLNNFGNIMLYSYQNTEDQKPRGFLKASTMREIWRPCPNTRREDSDFVYGLGWFLSEEDRSPKAFARRQRFSAMHTGGAIGASSALLILPPREAPAGGKPLPEGVVVAMIANQQEVGLAAIAAEIAQLFERARVHDSGAVGTIGGSAKNKVYTLAT